MEQDRASAVPCARESQPRLLGSAPSEPERGNSNVLLTMTALSENDAPEFEPQRPIGERPGEKREARSSRIARLALARLNHDTRLLRSRVLKRKLLTV